eukprot:11568366-Ditylum_brightwellii.AAC.1
MLHEAEVELCDLAGCITSYVSNRLADFTICAANPGMTNPCQGESGEPLLYNNHHGGISQVGTVCGDETVCFHPIMVYTPSSVLPFNGLMNLYVLLIWTIVERLLHKIY